MSTEQREKLNYGLSKYKHNSDFSCLVYEESVTDEYFSAHLADNKKSYPSTKAASSFNAKDYIESYIQKAKQLHQQKLEGNTNTISSSGFI